MTHLYSSMWLQHVKPINFHRISPAPHGAHGAQVQLATRLAPLRRRLPGPRGAEHRCGRSSVARRAGAAGRHGDQGAAGGHGAAERRLGELRCGEKARGNGQWLDMTWWTWGNHMISHDFTINGEQRLQRLDSLVKGRCEWHSLPEVRGLSHPAKLEKCSASQDQPWRWCSAIAVLRSVAMLSLRASAVTYSTATAAAGRCHLWEMAFQATQELRSNALEASLLLVT